MELASSGSHTENLLPFAPFKSGSVLNSPDPGFSDPTGLHWKSSKKAATPEVDWGKITDVGRIPDFFCFWKFASPILEHDAAGPS